MIKKGFMTVPMLEVNGECFDYFSAINWIKERK